VSTIGDLDRSRAPRRVRAVIERLIAERTAVARSDGTLSTSFSRSRQAPPKERRFGGGW
jgi:hypothetical protein